jgi:hypothetical protein
VRRYRGDHIGACVDVGVQALEDLLEVWPVSNASLRAMRKMSSPAASRAACSLPTISPSRSGRDSVCREDAAALRVDLVFELDGRDARLDVARMVRRTLMALP